MANGLMVIYIILKHTLEDGDLISEVPIDEFMSGGQTSNATTYDDDLIEEFDLF